MWSKREVVDDALQRRNTLRAGGTAAFPCPGRGVRRSEGRIRSTREFDEMQTPFGEFRVCVVEVCHECRWNHMIASHLLGDGKRRKPPRRQRTVEDIYG